MSTKKISSTLKHSSRDLFERVSTSPLLCPTDVVPSNQILEVVGVSNPGFVKLGTTRMLVVRIDEKPSDSHVQCSDGEVAVAAADIYGQSAINIYKVEVPNSFDPSHDPILPEKARVPTGKKKEFTPLLSYISHLRIATFSERGLKLDENPLAFPRDESTLYGCEDARVTIIDGVPLITYTGIGIYGATSKVATLTDDWQLADERTLFGPDHKHVILFPERCNNYYFSVSRPLSRTYAPMTGIWISRSPDLVYWGEPRPLLAPRKRFWDCRRVGPATPPIRTPEGWLLFYYGVDAEETYRIGAVLLDEWNPTCVLARTTVPLLTPNYIWERQGRRADVIFPCGIEIVSDSRIRLYYGAADTVVGAAEANLACVLKQLMVDAL